MNSNRCYLVMWPEEQDVSVAAGASTSFIASHQQQSSNTSSGAGSIDSMPQSPPKTLVHINGRGSTSSDEGAADTGVSYQQQQPTAAAMPTTSRSIPVARLAYPFVLPRDYAEHKLTAEEEESPRQQSSARTNNLQQHHGAATRFVVAAAGTDATTTTMVDTATTTFVPVSGSQPTEQQQSDHRAATCSKCLLRETENRNLRKRVHALEEQLCRAIGNKRPKLVSSGSGSGEPTLIALTPPASVGPVTPTTLSAIGSSNSPQKFFMRYSTSGSVTSNTRPPSSMPAGAASSSSRYDHQFVKTESGSSVRLVPIPANLQNSIDLSYNHQPSSSAIASNNTASSSSNRSNTSHNAASTPTSMRPSDKLEDDRIELVPGTNVFISTSKLQQILSVVKTGKQLARKLMSIYWDRITLARSTLSASSQHYDQLDPNTISAIKTFCVLFDSSSRKSEIHSTMIDKCVQARRPRRSSLRQPGHPVTTTASGASSPGVINLPAAGQSREVEDHQLVDMSGTVGNVINEEDVHTEPHHQQQLLQDDNRSKHQHPHSSAFGGSDNNGSSQIFRFSSSDIPKQQLTRSNTFMVPSLVGITPNAKDNRQHQHSPPPEEGTYFMISEDNVHDKSRESTPITKGSIVGPFTVLDEATTGKTERRSSYYTGPHGSSVSSNTTGVHQGGLMTSISTIQPAQPSPLTADSPSRRRDGGSPTLIIQLPADHNEPMSSLQQPTLFNNNQQSRPTREDEHTTNTTVLSSGGYHHHEVDVSEIIEFSDDNSNSSDSDVDSDSSQQYLIHIPPPADGDNVGSCNNQPHYQYTAATDTPADNHHHHHEKSPQAKQV